VVVASTIVAQSARCDGEGRFGERLDHGDEPFATCRQAS
jgi:hypothetical protein